MDKRVRQGIRGGALFSAIGVVIALIGLITGGPTAMMIAWAVCGLIFVIVGLYLFFVAYYIKKRDRSNE